MSTYGYIRVSSTDQNLSRQFAAMQESGISSNNIFPDKKSGKDFNREEYQRLVGSPDNLGILQSGDLLVILSIDRLGRDYDEILDQWAYITKTIGADIRVLDMPMLDTTIAANGLDGKFVSDLVLQILAYVAQKEREKILERQEQGIAIAKAQGRYTGANHRGRARLPVDAELFESTYGRWASGEIGQQQAAQVLGLTRQVLGLRFRERRRIGPVYNPNHRQGLYEVKTGKLGKAV